MSRRTVPQTFEALGTEISETIRTLLNERRWSQSDLSRLSGVPLSILHRCIHKRTLPSLITALQLAAAFDVSITALAPTTIATIGAEMDARRADEHAWRRPTSANQIATLKDENEELRRLVTEFQAMLAQRNGSASEPVAVERRPGGAQV
jgi:transcriptional regulator with XRE-family HTH domain